MWPLFLACSTPPFPASRPSIPAESDTSTAPTSNLTGHDCAEPSVVWESVGLWARVLGAADLTGDGSVDLILGTNEFYYIGYDAIGLLPGPFPVPSAVPDDMVVWPGVRRAELFDADRQEPLDVVIDWDAGGASIALGPLVATTPPTPDL